MTVPKIVDHPFYLWSDDDEDVAQMCGVGCSYGPPDHISAEDFAARERVRDAAPELLSALVDVENHLYARLAVYGSAIDERLMAVVQAAIRKAKGEQP